MRGDKIAKRTSFGRMIRRRLSDVTNSLPQSKSHFFSEKLPPDDASAKEYIDHLAKEKMALEELIQDKNKIIELSGTEIQNLRNCLQKMQLQNWSLAQSNSHMLAELTLTKEKLKTLQHEVLCKEALLKSKNLHPKGQEEMNIQKPEFQEPEVVSKETEFNEDARPCNAIMRRHLSRSPSLGSSMISQQNAEKEAAVSKRRCLRRQPTSSRIKREDRADNLFETDYDKFSVAPSNNTTNVAGQSPLTTSTRGVLTDGGGAPELESEARRTSIGRPSRKAAEKVLSYKERPINVKLRRSE